MADDIAITVEATIQNDSSLSLSVLYPVTGAGTVLPSAAALLLTPVDVTLSADLDSGLEYVTRGYLGIDYTLNAAASVTPTAYGLLYGPVSMSVSGIFDSFTAAAEAWYKVPITAELDSSVGIAASAGLNVLYPTQVNVSITPTAVLAAEPTLALTGEAFVGFSAVGSFVMTYPAGYVAATVVPTATVDMSVSYSASVAASYTLDDSADIDISETYMADISGASDVSFSSSSELEEQYSATSATTFSNITAQGVLGYEHYVSIQATTGQDASASLLISYDLVGDATSDQPSGSATLVESMHLATAATYSIPAQVSAPMVESVVLQATSSYSGWGTAAAELQESLPLTGSGAYTGGYSVAATLSYTYGVTATADSSLAFSGHASLLASYGVTAVSGVAVNGAAQLQVQYSAVVDVQQIPSAVVRSSESFALSGDFTGISYSAYMRTRYDIYFSGEAEYAVDSTAEIGLNIGYSLTASFTQEISATVVLGVRARYRDFFGYIRSSYNYRGHIVQDRYWVDDLVYHNNHQGD